MIRTWARHGIFYPAVLMFAMLGMVALGQAFEVTLKPAQGVDFETITVTSTAASELTAAKLNPVNSREVRQAYLTVETADIRFRVDGSSPTQSAGHLIDISMNDRVTIAGWENLRHLSMVGVGGTATVQVTYER